MCRGTAVICTPRGEQYKLRLGGDFQNPPAQISRARRRIFISNNYSTFSGSTDPSLDFRGKWNNPDLVLDDMARSTRAFDPGGELVTNHHMRPYMQEVVPLTLHQGSWSDFQRRLRRDESASKGVDEVPDGVLSIDAIRLTDLHCYQTLNK